MEPKVVAAIRGIVALVWLYEGLYMKLLARDPHEMAIVAAVGGPCGLTPTQFLFCIGSGETLLALGILSGLFYRPVAIFQATLLLVMNLIGIAMSQGEVADPIGLLVRNLPFLACMYLLWCYGPGAYTLLDLRNNRTAQPETAR